MCVIFAFSATNGIDSGKQSNGITKQIVRVVVPNYEKLPQMEQNSILKKAEFFVRKGAHMTVYAVLGLLCMLALFKYQIRHYLRYFLALCICFVYACSDEFHQSFIPGRGPGFKDVLIDTAGAMIGIVIIILFYKLKSFKKKQKAFK